MLADLARIPVDWHRNLDEVVELATTLGPRSAVVFDLDSTILDNRPRQAQLMRDYGREVGLEPLRACQMWHFADGWDLRSALHAVGVTDAMLASHFEAMQRYWRARFFTSEYAIHDVEILGAPRFVQLLASAHANVVYVTGRPEEMRRGTLACLRKCGFPIPDGRATFLMMKPTPDFDDDSFKRDAHGAIAERGIVVAAFDNEPVHINDYIAAFPGAKAFHLAIDHSGRKVDLDPRAISIPHFGR